jgi:hypothetical protein
MHWPIKRRLCAKGDSICWRKPTFLAVTVSHGYNDDKTDLFRLNRLYVGDGDSIKLLAVRASGVWAFFKYILSTLARSKDRVKWRLFLLLQIVPAEVSYPAGVFLEV